jgi:hypothetical protein
MAEIVVVAVCKKCGTIRTQSVLGTSGVGQIDLSGNCDLPAPLVG